MQFLRTVFWVVLAVLAVIFATANTKPIEVNLWAGIAWYPPTWFALLAAFLIGLVPTLVFYRAARWSLRRRLDNANRALIETRTPAEPVRTDYPVAAAEATPMMQPPGVL